jgi:hypothetical protein
MKPILDFAWKFPSKLFHGAIVTYRTKSEKQLTKKSSPSAANSTYLHIDSCGHAAEFG